MRATHHVTSCGIIVERKTKGGGCAGAYTPLSRDSDVDDGGDDDEYTTW